MAHATSRVSSNPPLYLLEGNRLIQNGVMQRIHHLIVYSDHIELVDELGRKCLANTEGIPWSKFHNPDALIEYLSHLSFTLRQGYGSIYTVLASPRLEGGGKTKLQVMIKLVGEVKWDKKNQEKLIENVKKWTKEQLTKRHENNTFNQHSVFTYLITQCAFIDSFIIELCLQKGIDPNESFTCSIHASGSEFTKKDMMMTPLHAASYANNIPGLQVVLLLVKAGANIEALDGEKETPLVYSFFSNLEDVSQSTSLCLIDQGANVNAVSPSRGSVLLIALEHYKSWQHLIVQKLVEHGARLLLDETDRIFTVRHADSGLIDQLLRNNTDFSRLPRRSVFKKSLVKEAPEEHKKIVRHLYKIGAIQPDAEAFYWAVNQGQTKLAGLFLEQRGLQLSVHDALKKEELAAVSFLIQRNKKLIGEKYAPDALGASETLFQVACTKGHVGLVQEMLALGWQWDATLLPVIFWCRSSEIVRIGIKHGANLNELDERGNPLFLRLALTMTATDDKKRKKEAVAIKNLLKEAGAMISLGDLIELGDVADSDLFESMLKRNADPNEQVEGVPVLALALLKNRAHESTLLIKSGATISQEAFLIALKNRMLDLVPLMLERGANPLWMMWMPIEQYFALPDSLKNLALSHLRKREEFKEAIKKFVVIISGAIPEAIMEQIGQKQKTKELEKMLVRLLYFSLPIVLFDRDPIQAQKMQKSYIKALSNNLNELLKNRAYFDPKNDVFDTTEMEKDLMLTAEAWEKNISSLL